MKDILDTWQPPNQSSVLLQYVDDLLLCSESLENSETDSKSLLMFLEEVGCKASKHKLQLCAKTVVFLGHCISQGMKHLTPDRLEIIQKHPVPRNPKQLRTFLGLIGYCRAWIRDASAMMQPLYDCLTSDPFVLSPEAIDNFHSLKLSLTTRPALGLPDYNKPFTLFCHEQAGHASGVLAQDHGGKMRPLAYYSLALDPIVLGSPTCIRAVSAAAALVDKATDIVLQHDIIVQVPHAVQEMMNTVKTKHLSVARLTKIELTLLSPNVTIKRCVVLNPATLLPLDSEQKEGGVGGQGHGHPLIFQLSTDDELFNFEHEHDCQSLVDMESNGINSIFDVALINPDAEYFVDGSRYWSEDKGHFLTGYAVVHNDPNFLSGTHSLQPGDWVVTKIHNRSSLEPRYSQPVEVQLVTATSVKLQGRANWIHASHCKKVISPDDVASNDDVALGRVGVDVAPRGDDDSSSQGGSGQ
ncbi:uncharacterized protein LOC142698232 [Rhinoderma darwinii]|uniref:uncharacterized protein LOC142698232 n=1 Tax=Rhinoderma darwinii TaxID=43563 RepID=UPI003F67C0A3